MFPLLIGEFSVKITSIITEWKIQLHNTNYKNTNLDDS